MHMQGVLTFLSSLTVPESPAAGVDSAAYGSYIDAYNACSQDRAECRKLAVELAGRVGVDLLQGAGALGGVAAGSAETVYSWAGGVLKSAGEAGVEATEQVKACAKATDDCVSSGLNSGVTAAVADGARCAVGVTECVVRGKNYWKNKKKRERRGVVGSGESQEEREATRTLAVRRSAENALATKQAQHRLRALEDDSRTEAVERLAAARLEENINRSKLRSQNSYSKIDKSLKGSLGSAGSAGEFALKKQIKRGEEYRIRAEYYKEQMEKVLPLMPSHVRESIAALAPPSFPTDEEVFGECPADWPEAEREAYYREQMQHDAALAEEFADYRPVVEPVGMDFAQIRCDLEKCLGNC